MTPVRSRLQVIAAAVLFSTGGAAIKLATLDGWQVASFRSAIAAIVLLAAIPRARVGWSWRLLPTATAYAATLITFVLATKLTTAANAIFLQSTAPLYILVLGPLLLRERVGRADLLYVSVVAAGIALLFLDVQPVLATASDPHRGNLIAVGSGMSWALTIIGLRWIGRADADATVATVVAGNLLACGAALPLALPVTHMGHVNVGVLLYLGAVQIGLAYALLTRAIRYVPAFEATTLLLIEPVMNPMWTWLVHGEQPGALALAGGAIILGATFVRVPS